MGFLEKQGPVETVSTIIAFTSEDADAVDITEGNYVKWQVTLETVSKSVGFEVRALERLGAVSWTVYGKIRSGGALNYSIDITSDGTTITFEVTNNEADTINATLIRLL